MSGDPTHADWVGPSLGPLVGATPTRRVDGQCALRAASSNFEEEVFAAILLDEPQPSSWVQDHARHPRSCRYRASPGRTSKEARRTLTGTVTTWAPSTDAAAPRGTGPLLDGGCPPACPRKWDRYGATMQRRAWRTTPVFPRWRERGEGLQFEPDEMRIVTGGVGSRYQRVNFPTRE